MRKNDYLLAAVICLAAAVFWAVQAWNGGNAATVSVKVNGREYGNYSLYEDREIKIEDTNLLVIRDQKAYMKWADCKDQLCVHQKAIDAGGESIICLPNEVVVTISGKGHTEPGTDAVAQ